MFDATVLSPPHSRRRAALSVRRLRGGAVVGFHERQGNRIVDLTECTVMEPALQAVLPAFREAFGSRLAEGAVADL